MTVEEAYKHWLDTATAGKSHRDWIEYWESKPRDIQWAFSAGFFAGQMDAIKELQE